MSQDWYYAIGEDRKGPVSLRELRDLVDEGTVRPADLVWNDDMDDWKEARRVDELRGYGGRGWSRADQDQREERGRDRYDRDRYDRDRYDDDRRGNRRIPADISSQRTTAGILAILLGQFGVHKFYLGFNGSGAILLTCTLVALGLGIVSCGMLFFLQMVVPIITLIEGIMYLTKSDKDFHYDYNIRKKEWF